jgi:hypothetical protein
MTHVYRGRLAAKEWVTHSQGMGYSQPRNRLLTAKEWVTHSQGMGYSQPRNGLLTGIPSFYNTVFTTCRNFYITSSQYSQYLPHTSTRRVQKKLNLTLFLQNIVK